MLFSGDGCRLTTRGVTVRILLVEDDEDLRTEIREYLQRRVHEVTACGSLREAQLVAHRLAASGAFADVVVCDVNLPDGNGAEFYASMADQFPACHWVLMSGAHDVDRIEALQAGSRRPRCTVVEKPMSLRTLNSVLSRT